MSFQFGGPGGGHHHRGGWREILRAAEHLLKRAPRDLLGLLLIGLGLLIIIVSLPIPLWLWATLVGGSLLGVGWHLYGRR